MCTGEKKEPLKLINVKSHMETGKKSWIYKHAWCTLYIVYRVFEQRIPNALLLMLKKRVNWSVSNGILKHRYIICLVDFKWETRTCLWAYCRNRMPVEFKKHLLQYYDLRILFVKKSLKHSMCLKSYNHPNKNCMNINTYTIYIGRRRVCK